MIILAKNIGLCIEYHLYYSYLDNIREKTKKLSVDLRQRIINLHKSVNSYSTTSNWLAIPRSTVQSVLKKFKQSGTTENSNCHWEQHENCEVNKKQRVVLKDMAKSLETIQICLNRNGLYGNKEPLLAKVLGLKKFLLRTKTLGWWKKRALWT